MPHVILTPNPCKGWQELSTAQRSKVSFRVLFARDNYTCQYCGLAAASLLQARKVLTVDHVKPVHLHEPRSQATAWDNVTSACRSCNARKGGWLPMQCSMYPISTPKEPHFVQQRFAGRLNLIQKTYVTDYYGLEKGVNVFSCNLTPVKHNGYAFKLSSLKEPGSIPGMGSTPEMVSRACSSVWIDTVSGQKYQGSNPCAPIKHNGYAFVLRAEKGRSNRSMGITRENSSERVTRNNQYLQILVSLLTGINQNAHQVKDAGRLCTCVSSQERPADSWKAASSILASPTIFEANPLYPPASHNGNAVRFNQREDGGPIPFSGLPGKHNGIPCSQGIKGDSILHLYALSNREECLMYSQNIARATFNSGMGASPAWRYDAIFISHHIGCSIHPRDIGGSSEKEEFLGGIYSNPAKNQTNHEHSETPTRNLDTRKRAETGRSCFGKAEGRWDLVATPTESGRYCTYLHLMQTRECSIHSSPIAFHRGLVHSDKKGKPLYSPVSHNGNAFHYQQWKDGGSIPHAGALSRSKREAVCCSHDMECIGLDYFFFTWSLKVPTSSKPRLTAEGITSAIGEVRFLFGTLHNQMTRRRK